MRMQMPDVRGMIDMNTDAGRAMADAMVALQAQIIAFSQDYQMVMIFMLCAIPLAIIDRLHQGRAAQAIGGAGTCGDRVAAPSVHAASCCSSWCST